MLTRTEVSPAILLQSFCGKFEEVDESVKKLIYKLGENQTGMILMRLRTYLQKLDPLNKFFLPPIQRRCVKESILQK